ncbi:MAG: hypothetical protein ACRCUC_02230, partial [Aestuariivirga sp.]
KFLSKDVLDGVFRHLEAKAKNETDREKLKTEVTIETIKAELTRRAQQADLVKASLSHRIMWFPAFVICLDVAILFTAHIVDAIWQLPGDVAALDATMAGVFMAALTFMFATGK